MIRQALAAVLAAGTLCGAAQAAIPFYDVRYDASAVAVTGDGTPGAESLAGLLGDEGASVAASSTGAADVATAGAFVGLGLLTTSADAAAASFGSAVATSRFIGSFVNGGAVNLAIDFSALDFATGSGQAATTLFVSLVSNGVTLFADYVSDGLWQTAYQPVAGTVSVLDLTLTSDASAAFLGSDAGNASAFGLVAITGAVPETSTWLMLAFGLGAIGAVRRKTRQAATGA